MNSTPTIIRSKEVGNWLGLVVTTMAPDFDARFQLYRRGLDLPEVMLLIRSEFFDE